MEDDILIVCCTIILNIFIIVINGCPILNCMIHYNVCNDKGKHCAILWSSGNYCGQLEVVIPLAHRAIGFKTMIRYQNFNAINQVTITKYKIQSIIFHGR